MSSGGRSAKTFVTELAWLLSSWAFSYLLVGGLLGYLSPQGYRLFWANPPEIQMHNTYFVLDVFSATLPFFILTALVTTSIRALRGGSRRAASITLVIVLLVLLLAAVVIGVAYSRFQAQQIYFQEHQLVKPPSKIIKG